MKTEKPTKSESFVLVVDRDAYRVLNYIMNIFDAQGPGAMSILYKKGLTDRTLNLMKEFADKAHKANFCEDPKCPHKKGTAPSVEEKTTDSEVDERYTNPDIGSGYIQDGLAVIDLGKPTTRIRFNKTDLKSFILGMGTLYENL